MTNDDDTLPRGFVHMRDYLKVRREVERLSEELAYAKWRLGNGVGDEERCSVAGARLRLRRGDVRFLLRIARNSPMPIFSNADEYPDSAKIYACRIRQAIKRDGGNPRVIQTVNMVGYMITKPGLVWVEQWVPELFRPLADVMGEYQATNYEHASGGSRGKQGSSGIRQ